MKRVLRHLKAADPVMSGIVERVGAFDIEYSPADFATFAFCIVNQQLSGKAAMTIYNRLEEAASNGRRMTPDEVLRLRPRKMRALGLSARKTEYIREVARHFRDGKVNMEALAALSDAEVMRQLTRIRGVGEWTVHMLLI
ncbi:MAG: DNA-3-methyladenine glycosylase 2 family protein, partial [bacterium]|nr:DNA-3-methyladenine glycosylase 2 family protein [bacterium]